MKPAEINPIENYIAQFPENVQEIMLKIREIILVEAPEAEEKISYGMPAYFYKKKPLVYFAGFKNHIGLYATPKVHESFAQKLSKYKQGKGSVQFPLNQEIPYGIIKEMLILKKQSLD